MKPQLNKEPVYLQIYFMGSENIEAERRHSIQPKTNLNTIIELQRMLHNNNSYINSFKTAMEQNQQENLKIIIRADKKPENQHRSRYNKPSVDEVAILMVGEGGSSRDIILNTRDSTIKAVEDTHRSYDALQYPLLFCRGEDGYNYSDKQVNINLNTKN